MERVDFAGVLTVKITSVTPFPAVPAGNDPCFTLLWRKISRLAQKYRLLIYADDTTLLVPSNSDVDLEDEFENVQQWAKDNRMILNF